MSKIIYLFSLFCICGYIHSQEKIKADYDYLLYLPEGYSEQTKIYPLVIYLHGGSHKGNDLDKLKEEGHGIQYLYGKFDEMDE